MNRIKYFLALRHCSKFLSAALVLAAVFILATLTPVLLPATAQSPLTAAIHGYVTAETTGDPIPGAQVAIPILGLQATTNSAGEFSWEGIMLDDDVEPVTVHITAQNFGEWTLQDVRVLRDETLIIKAKLEKSPVTIVIAPPSNERMLPPDSLTVMGAAESGGPIGAPGDFPIPDTIRVRVTGNPYCNTTIPYTVEVIDFKDYVKHVLPNEWWASWPGESLRAGAMAAKMYAWYWIAAGGKWDDADVYDSTCDQVYNPAVEYESTNLAVDFTWNWLMMRDSQFILTQYRAYDYQCGSADCMGQWDSRDKALNSWTWDEILLFYYEPAALEPVWNPPGGFSLRFNGIYHDEENRVRISIDDPTDGNPGPPADIGAQDFTIEWWMKALPGENNAAAIACGGNKDWLTGNVIFDRNRFGEDRGYGVSMAGEKLVFGVSGDGSGDLTICGSSNLADGTWHHFALQRNSADGWLQLFVDGVLEAEGDGPDGDVSYPDDYTPPDLCGISGDQPCINSDPYLVIGAEKHRSSSAHPSFSGWIDEIRFSNVLRYSADFTVPSDRFTPDANTVALYQLNEGFGNLIYDTSGFAGGPSDGKRIYGGVINGPEWTDDTHWYVAPTTPTPTPTNTPTPTPTPTVTPTPSSVTFAVIGDYGTTSTAASDVGTLVSSWDPDLILTTGDNNYPDGAASTIDDNIGQYYSEFIYPYTGSYSSSATENHFFPSLGNHDWYTTDAQPYLD
ncbi:MAG: LamG-like jellyroll fold domain-containing protein, partial [Anaerolineales bacterium]